MGLIRWIVGFIIAILAAAFAVFNRADVAVTWNPLAAPVNAPLYLVALAAMGFGFLIGALMVWMNMIQFRFDARRQKRHIRKLEHDLEEAEKREEKLDTGRSKFLPGFLTKKKA